MRISTTLSFAATLLAFAPIAAQAAPLKAVVFDLELVDSGSGPQTAEAARVKKASDDLRKLLVASGQMTVVDTTPQAAEIAKNLPLRNCHECDLDIAKALGADIEVTTAMQKISTVILGFSGSIRDVKTGRVLRTGTVDIRGDTDDMWAHGIKFLVKDRLLDPPLPQDPDALKAMVDKAP